MPPTHITFAEKSGPQLFLCCKCNVNTLTYMRASHIVATPCGNIPTFFSRSSIGRDKRGIFRGSSNEALLRIRGGSSNEAEVLKLKAI